MFKYQAKIIVQKFHSFSLIVNLVHMVWLWTLHYFGKHKSQPNDVNRSIDLRISQLLHQTQPPWSKTMENTDIQLAHSRYKNPCLHQKCKFSWRTLKLPFTPSPVGTWLSTSLVAAEPHSTTYIERSIKSQSRKGSLNLVPQMKHCIYPLLHTYISFCRHLHIFRKLKLGAGFIGGTWSYQLCRCLGVRTPK